METAVAEIGVQKYEAYKESGVDWIGEVPAHWELEKGKWLFQKQDRPVRADDDIVTCFRDGQVTLRINRKTEGFTNALKEHGYQGIRKGDLVIHAMDAFAGAIGVSDSDGKATPVYAACTPRVTGSVNSFFFAYLLRNMAKTGLIESLAKGIRERSTDFRYANFGALELTCPPLAEQTAIADFLDRKIAQIDQAIAQKERLIELLQERRQVLIQRAVTRGLNHDAPMNDSGVEWIGEIPAHWEVKKLKYVLAERDERSPDGSEPLLMMSQIHGLVVRADYHEKAQVAKSSEGNKVVHPDDLVFNKLKAHLGVFFKSTLIFKGIVSPDYAVYHSVGNLADVKYLELLFKLPNYIGQFISRATGIAEGLIRLYTSDLFDIKVPIPEQEEQKDILDFVSALDTKVSEAVHRSSGQIEKLREYKSTLINAAVTGKIKVC